MIRLLLNSGHRFSSGRLTLYHDKDIPGLEESFAGAYLVPKTAGNAVRRNRLKRWMREDIRLMQKDGSFRLKGGVAIRYRGSADGVTHLSLTEDLKNILKQIKYDA